MKSKWFKIRDPFAVLVIVLVFVALSIFGVINDQKNHKKGIFAIATITEANKSKSGTRVKAIFYYDKKSYVVRFNPGYSFDRTIGRKFFIKFLPNNPMKYDYYDVNVPSCASNDLDKTWTKLPDCN